MYAAYLEFKNVPLPAPPARINGTNERSLSGRGPNMRAYTPYVTSIRATAKVHPVTVCKQPPMKGQGHTSISDMQGDPRSK